MAFEGKRNSFPRERERESKGKGGREEKRERVRSEERERSHQMKLVDEREPRKKERSWSFICVGVFSVIWELGIRVDWVDKKLEMTMLLVPYGNCTVYYRRGQRVVESRFVITLSLSTK